MKLCYQLQYQIFIEMKDKILCTRKGKLQNIHKQYNSICKNDDKYTLH